MRALFSLSGMIFAYDLHFIEKLFGSQNKFFTVTTILTIASLVLLGVFPTISTVLLSVVFLGGLGQARFMMISSNMNHFISSGQRATTLSTISMLNRIVLIVLNPIVGYMADYTIKGALLFIAILSLITLLFPIPHISYSKKNVK
jgi:hypothetical protein